MADQGLRGHRDVRRDGVGRQPGQPLLRGDAQRDQAAVGVEGQLTGRRPLAGDGRREKQPGGQRRGKRRRGPVEELQV
jgi:hypothetical protein